MRPDKDKTFLNIASTLALRGTCIRKQVGCVLVDKLGQILSTGYNGVARGLPHCNEGNACAGAGHDSGQGLEICEAIHAEQNALLQCHDVQQIDTVYVTASPCRHCMKLIMNTSAKRVVFLSEYSQSSKDLADKAGIKWIKYVL